MGKNSEEREGKGGKSPHAARLKGCSQARSDDVTNITKFVKLWDWLAYPERTR